MRKELTLLSAVGVVWALNLGACAGPDVLVGANAGKSGGGSGTGNEGVPRGNSGSGVTSGGGESDASGAGGSSVAATGGVGTSASSDGSSARGGNAGAQSDGASASGGMPSSSLPSDSVTHYVTEMWFAPEFTGPRCLPRPLAVDASGAASCEIYRATLVAADGGGCSCDGPGLSGPVESAVRDSVIGSLQILGVCSEPSSPTSMPPQPLCEDECVCQWAQAQGSDRAACQNGQTPTDSSGWCYLAPDEGFGDPALVANCQPEPQALIFYGDAMLPESIGVVACALRNPSVDPAPAAAPLGAPCLMGDEYLPTFNGYALTEVTVDDQSPACASGVCIINHFQGRVSCPYGQGQRFPSSDSQCFVPNSNDLVTVNVDAQLVAMPAAERVVCSCRCDGPGPGPFCACPNDMECSPLIQDFGLPGDNSVVGSYCIPKGTAYDPQGVIPAATCDISSMNCGDPRPY